MKFFRKTNLRDFKIKKINLYFVAKVTAAKDQEI